MFRKQNLCPGSKNVFDLRQKHFLVSEQQNLFPQHMFPARLNSEIFVAVTRFPSLAMSRKITSNLEITARKQQKQKNKLSVLLVSGN